jgi:hypothetical protein
MSLFLLFTARLFFLTRLEPRRPLCSFFFVEGSTDEDGHLNDISSDDLKSTSSFDSVEQVCRQSFDTLIRIRDLVIDPNQMFMFHCVWQFWYYYDHIVRANELPPNTDCCFFKVLGAPHTHTHTHTHVLTHKALATCISQQVPARMHTHT